jgi:hypothetical protein
MKSKSYLEAYASSDQHGKSTEDYLKHPLLPLKPTMEVLHSASMQVELQK